MATQTIEQRRNSFRFVQAIFNPLATIILRSPLHGIMSSRLLLITFSGRKSGRQFTTPISYAPQGDTLLIAVGGPWWKNLRGGAAVSVRLRGKTVPGTANIITDEEELFASYGTILAYNPTQGRFMGVKAGPDGRPDSDDLHRAIDRGAAVVKIQLKA